MFGCACFPLLRPCHAYKLEFRSHLMNVYFLVTLLLTKATSVCHPLVGCTYLKMCFLMSQDFHIWSCSPSMLCLMPQFHLKLNLCQLYSLCYLSQLCQHLFLFQPFPSLPPLIVNHQSPSTTASSESGQPIPSANSTLEPQPSLSVSSHRLTPSSTSAASSSVAVTEPLESIPHNAVLVSKVPVNKHSMQTRAKSGFVQPRLAPKLLLTHTEPKTVKQALTDSEWKGAMRGHNLMLFVETRP